MAILIFCVKRMKYALCVRTKSSQKDVLSSQYAKKHVISIKLFRQLVDFHCCHQECPGAVKFRHIPGYFFRIGSDRLYPTQLSGRFDGRDKRLPSFFDYGEIFVCREITLVDTVGQSVDDKSGGTGFRRGIAVGV